MSVESILNWLLEATTTTILPEWEIIGRVESLQQTLVAFSREVQSILETLQIVWIRLLPMGGYYTLKICIMKTIMRFKEEMVDHKEFVHLIYDNITHDNALKNHGEEFAHLMPLVTELYSTVFGPRSWFRINDYIEVLCNDDGETCVPATYIGRHHIDGQCVIAYNNERRTADGNRVIFEVVPNGNILGKRKKIPLGPVVEGMTVEVFHGAGWKPAVTKARVATTFWGLKLGEKYLESNTRCMRSYQPINDRRLCDSNKDNFRFLCSDGKCYSCIHLYGTESESESDEEPETEKTTRVISKTPVIPETASAKTLSVCNLPESVQRADVENFFKDAGEVVDLSFSTNEEGMFRGLGHVEFATVEAAMKALDLNGRDLSGHAVRIAYMDFMDDDS